MSRIEQLTIDPDIRRAGTLPAWVCADPDALAAALSGR